MPSTRSQAGADSPAGEASEVAEALEEAAAKLSAEIAARNNDRFARNPVSSSYESVAPGPTEPLKL